MLSLRPWRARHKYIGIISGEAFVNMFQTGANLSNMFGGASQHEEPAPPRPCYRACQRGQMA